MQRVLPGKCGSKINVVIVAVNSLVAGLCAAWPSAVFPKILQEGQLLHLNLDEIALSVVFLYIGQLAALVPFPVVENSIGKAKTLGFGILFALLGWIVIILYVSNIGIYFAMILFGCWITVSALSNGPYLAEVSPPKLRGRILALMSIFFMVGAITEIILSIFLTYKQLALVNFGLTVLQFTLLFTLPETPYFFLRKYNVRAAMKRFEWFRGAENIKEFDDAVQLTEKQMNDSPKFVDVCKDFSTRKALIFSLTMTCFQKISANVPLQTYSGIILPNSYIESGMFPLLFFSISAVFNIISAVFIDRLGRRKLLLISSSGSCVLSFCTAVWFFIHERTRIDLKSYSFVPYMTVALETAFYSLGAQYIPGVINGEIFAAHVKSKALSIIAFAAISHNVINSKVFIVFVQQKLTFVNFTVYSIMSAISFFYLMTIFDTKGKTLEEIYNHFERKGRKRSTLVANLVPQDPEGKLSMSEQLPDETATPKPVRRIHRASWAFGHIPSDFRTPFRRTSSLPDESKRPSIKTKRPNSQPVIIRESSERAQPGQDTYTTPTEKSTKK